MNADSITRSWRHRATNDSNTRRFYCIGGRTDRSIITLIWLHMADQPLSGVRLRAVSTELRQAVEVASDKILFCRRAFVSR